MSASPQSARKSRISASTIVAGVLSALLVLFALLNSQSVTIHWVLTTTTAPLIVVIIGCGLVGFAAGWLLSRRSAKRRAR